MTAETGRSPEALGNLGIQGRVASALGLRRGMVLPMDRNRREPRTSLIPFRMSEQEKAQLAAEAKANGWTLQQLMEQRVWGAPRPKRRTNGKEIPTQTETLDVAV